MARISSGATRLAAAGTFAAALGFLWLFDAVNPVGLAVSLLIAAALAPLIARSVRHWVAKTDPTWKHHRIAPGYALAGQWVRG